MSLISLVALVCFQVGCGMVSSLSQPAQMLLRLLAGANAVVTAPLWKNARFFNSIPSSFFKDGIIF